MSRNWTFGQKLGAGFGLVVLLALIMAGIGSFALERVVEAKDAVIRQADQNLIDAEAMRGAMHKETSNVRGLLLAREEVFGERLNEARAELVAVLDAIRARPLSPEAAALMRDIASAHEAHQRELDTLLGRLRAGEDPVELATEYEQDVLAKFEALRGRVVEFMSLTEREREAQRQEASAEAQSAETALMAAGGGVSLLGILLAWFLTTGLTRQIASSVQHIRSSSAELQAAATQQASGAKEQATAMSEITTTISELLATSRQIADSGQHVAKMAADSAGSARGGADAVNNARIAVSSIQKQVETIVHHMLDLGKKSQQVGSILEIINELAEQTNILAINATIEAAGAGEHGRRFAVVGEEIRKLADRVGGSTKEIRALIEDIRAAVNATVMATETGSKTVDAGAQRFEALQAEFARIGELVASTMEAGKEIELSTKQQASAVEQVNVAISNVAQATKETEASSAQTLQTASELTTLSNELSSLVQAQRA